MKIWPILQDHSWIVRKIDIWLSPPPSPCQKKSEIGSPHPWWLRSYVKALMQLKKLPIVLVLRKVSCCISAEGSILNWRKGKYSVVLALRQVSWCNGPEASILLYWYWGKYPIVMLMRKVSCCIDAEESIFLYQCFSVSVLLQLYWCRRKSLGVLVLRKVFCCIGAEGFLLLYQSLE